MVRTTTVTLPVETGGHLEGSVALAGGPDAVLYVHGFGSDRWGVKAQALRVACARRGWNFAAFDFRCHGGSSGAMVELRGSGLQADLEAIRLYLARQGARRLFLAGSSMGGWASAWYALAHPDEVPALVLMAPAFRFLQRRWDDLDEAARRAWQESGRLRLRNQWIDVEVGHGLVAERADFDPERLAERWRTPALIFHGMRDETVPWQDTLALVERAGYPHIEVRLLRDGDHRLLAYAEEMAEEGCRFFGRWWRGSPCEKGEE
jgi:pimeloyl-ACP methyl ester carboxylesterase